MAAGTFVEYDVFRHQLGLEKHLLGTDTLKVALFTATHTPNAASDVSFSALTNEHSATDTGYTAGGATLTSTWTTAILNASNTVWTAGTSGITAKWAVVYNSSAGGTNDLIAYVELESGGTVSVTSGNTLTIDYNDTDGILKLT